MDQLTYAALLTDHAMVVTFVRPRVCTGLDDFAEHDALRLDVGRALVPPMYPAVHPEGLHCYASFGGVTRCVYVPWSAVIWAGSEEQFQRRARA